MLFRREPLRNDTKTPSATDGPRTNVPAEQDRGTWYQETMFAEILGELRTLRLNAECFDPEDFAERLAAYLDVEIRIVPFNDVHNPLLRRKMAHHGITGGLFYEPDSRTVWIVYPTSLSCLARARLIFHELSHLAAGHPIAPKYLVQNEDPQNNRDTTTPLAPWTPPRRLASYAPPANDKAACERDADLRATHLLKASLFGPKIYERQRFFLGLKDLPAPRPRSLGALSRLLAVVTNRVYSLCCK